MFGMTQKVQMVISGDSSGAVGAIRRVSDEAGRLNSRGGGFLRSFAGGLVHIGKVALIAAGTLGVGALTAAVGALSIVLVKGFQRLTGIEDARKSLEGLGHTAKEVNDLMAQALKAVKGTAFSLDEAATVMASATAAGVAGGKEMYQYLRLVADAATIAHRPLSEMGLIFNKVTAGGYSGEIQNQLTEAGIPIGQWMEIVAKQNGISPKKYEKLRKAGDIPGSLFLQAMQGGTYKNAQGKEVPFGLGGSAIKQGNATTTGALKNTWAAVARLGASLLAGPKGNGGIFKQIRPMILDFNKNLDKLGPIAGRVGNVVGKAFKNIVKWLREFAGRKDVQDRIKAIASSLWRMATALGRFVTSEKFISTMKSIAKVVVDIGKRIYQWMSTDTVAKIVAVAAAFGAFKLLKFAEWAGGLITLARGIAGVSGVMGLFSAAGGPFLLAAAGIGIAAFLIYKNWDKVWPVLQKVGHVIGKVLSPVLDAVGAVIGWVRKHWDGLIDGFLIAIGPIGWVIAWIIHHWDTFKEKVGDVFGWVHRTWDKLWKFIADSPIGKVMGDIAKGVQMGVEAIGRAWGGIKSFFVNAINWIVRNVLRPAFSWTGITFKEIGGGNSPYQYAPVSAHSTPGGAISAHAEGGIITKPHIGLVGEDGPELILPLTKPDRMNKLLKQANILPYAKGGFVGNVSSFFSKVWEGAKNIKDAVGTIIGKALGGAASMLSKLDNSPLAGVIESALKIGSKKLISALTSKVQHGGKGGQFYGDVPGLRGKIIANATEHVGAPYVWGGTGPNGFDCSGLVYHAYLQAGHPIPRIPVYGGRAIPASQMQPADVLGYYPGAVQGGVRVPFGHYKMFIGNGKTVESTSGGVQIRPYTPAAQVRTFLFKGWHGKGGSFLVDRPTLFGVGEAGPEQVDITPRGGGGSRKEVHVHVHMPGGTTLVGMAEDVGDELGPYVQAGIAQAEQLASFGRP